MNRWQTKLVPVALLGTAAVVAGCCNAEKCALMGDIRPLPLGTHVDPWFKAEEANAEAADFVIHEHEWVGNSAILNNSGKDHVKQIAYRALQQQFPIIVEPSSKTVAQDSQFQYPTSNDSELDVNRRAMIVEALQVLGISDADARVVVAKDIVPGSETYDLQRSMSSGLFGGNAGGGIGGGGSGGGAGGFGR